MLHRPTRRDCARALWLLGLEPPVTHRELGAAWRARVGQAHPDRHQGDGARREAAETLTRALNAAREVVERWIASGDDWPAPLSGRARPPDEPRRRRPPPPRHAGPSPLRPCAETGLVPGDRVRVWPYDGASERVEWIERDAGGSVAWVRLEGGTLVRACRVRLASFSCLVCGACAGPAVADPALRPCPECLADLRRLEQAPDDAERIRRALEARATAGLAAARAVGDRRLEDRARSRRGWARTLEHVGSGELQRALLERFSYAFEAWAGAGAQTVASPNGGFASASGRQPLP